MLIFHIYRRAVLSPAKPELSFLLALYSYNAITVLTMGLVDACTGRVEDIITRLCPGASHLVSSEWEEKAACVYGARVGIPSVDGGDVENKVVILWAYTSPSDEYIGINGGRYHKGIKKDRLLHNNKSREGYFVFDDDEPFECFVFELAGQRIGFVYRDTDLPIISPDQAAGVLKGNAAFVNDDSDVNVERDFSSKSADEVHAMDAGRYDKWYRTYVHKAATTFKEEIEEVYEITGMYDFWEYTRNVEDSPDLPLDYRARYPFVIFIAFIKEEGGTRVVWRLTHSGKLLSCLRYDTSKRRTILFESVEAAGEILDSKPSEFRNYYFSYDEGVHTFSMDKTIVLGLNREQIRLNEEASSQIEELAKRYVNTEEESQILEYFRKEFRKHFGEQEAEEKAQDAFFKYQDDQLRPR